MDKKLIVVDDFYENPDDVRALASELEFSVTGHFQGKSSKLNEHCDSLNLTVIDKLSTLLNAPIIPETVNTAFKLSLAKDISKSKTGIHTDLVADITHYYHFWPSWNLIVYLSQNSEYSDTFKTYRHKKTSAEGFDYTGLYQSAPLDDYENITLWDEEISVTAAYNRAILVPSKLYHGPGKLTGFGDSFKNGRLLQLTLFNTGENFDFDFFFKDKVEGLAEIIGIFISQRGLAKLEQELFEVSLNRLLGKSFNKKLYLENKELVDALMHLIIIKALKLLSESSLSLTKELGIDTNLLNLSKVDFIKCLLEMVHSEIRVSSRRKLTEYFLLNSRNFEQVELV
jgi:hypothetical protein